MSRNKRRRLTPPLLLLEYPFLMPLVLLYLNDSDVMTRLLLIGKSIRPCLEGYTLKHSVAPALAQAITGWNVYLPVTVSEMREWNGDDLRSYTALKHLYAHEHFNKAIPIAQLPISLRSITLSNVFDVPITCGMFPPFMTEIDFGDIFNQAIPVDALPHALQSLTLGASFNQPLSPGAIPHSVKTFMFGKVDNKGKFNQPLAPGVLPNSLTTLFMGGAFNQRILPKHLPASLQRLTFGYKFNQPLAKNVLPAKLAFLQLGGKFSAALFLPQTLQHLYMFCPVHRIPIVGSMPMSLVELSCRHESADVLPAGLLPTSLRKLKIKQPVVIGSVPVGVTGLAYGANHEVPVGAIPPTVTTLIFRLPYNLPVLPGVIPHSVTNLEFGPAFNQLILPRSIPSSVRIVTFGRAFNTVLMPGVLPDSATQIVFDRKRGRFNRPLLTMDVSLQSVSRILGSIPLTVTHLALSRDFNQPLCVSSLPNITHLAVGKNFSHPLTCDALPALLKDLVLPKDTSYRFDKSECHFDVRMTDDLDFI